MPNLQLNEELEYNIGIWGHRYRQHLKIHYKDVYYNYLMQDMLYHRLAEVDKRAENMFDQLVKSHTEKKISLEI